ncbi:MAG TPA: zinc ribbon domain-containing protein [Ktedonobacteraceae bacterium]|nr:zinc ribbon domain-containing protein [Ktedonobacteraceae bacterium]
MNTVCPRCHTLLEAGTRFCTNCGSVVDVQAQSSPPSWASANPGGAAYQQQSWGAAGASPLDSLGFASQNASIGQGLNNDAVLKKALLAVVGLIIGTLALLFFLGVLAVLVPQLRCVFLIAIAFVLLIPWIIYVNIRRYIRRTIGTIGRIGWFF